MRKFFLRVLLLIIPLMWWIYASAQPNKKTDCSTTCFSSEVVSTEQLSSTCTVYEVKVAYSGRCAHALSHFSIAIPCGQVQNVWNSGGWKHEIGTDPTTGIRGLKIDDISDFGEGNSTSFSVKFTVCTTDDDCSSPGPCWQPQVAYKAGTCVNYETLAAKCARLEAAMEGYDASCFGSADGGLAVIIKSGQEPYSFRWSDGSTEQSRTGLPAGDYQVVVQDGSGAEKTLTGTVGEPQKISIAGQLTPASCSGTADGTLDITVSGGTGSYTYHWSNGAETEDLRSLSAGKYTVIVRDEKNCTGTVDFYIENNSAINVTAAQTKPDCNDTNGSIDIAISGGSEPYTFNWSTGASTEDLNNIGTGLYKVVVTDNAGCSVERSYLIHETNTLRVSGISIPTSCADDVSGAIDLSVSGGTMPYQFRWSNGETIEDPTGLSSGYYSVVVTDAKGCQITNGFTVSKKTFTVPKEVMHPSCHGDDNGSITLGEPIGGTPPYTYLWSSGETSNTLTDLPAGSYLVTVTDATGCSRTISTTVADPQRITATASVSMTDCDVDGSFAIDLTVTGGTAPYSFEWSDGSTSEDRTSVAKGSYTVVITDANACQLTKEVTVEGQGAVWACTIENPVTSPVCRSTDNTLSTSIADADAYSWTVQSGDGSWSIISGADSPTISYAAGSENISATFTLQITRDGCTRSCSYTIAACTPDENDGEEPGGEDPGGEDPGGEEPGGEEPGGEEPGSEAPSHNQPCDTCFDTDATLITVAGGCRTYEMVIETNGLCRHDLSHWTLAVPCGTISNYSNSRGWKMEYGKDPTTGLYGLKVDDIPSFGKKESSFTVTFTLCETGNCDLSYWDPTVAYKAGLCVAVQNIEVNEIGSQASPMAVYPNPFTNEVHFEWKSQRGYVSLEIIDQYGNVVYRSTRGPSGAEGYSLTMESSSLPRGIYYYRMTADGALINGKLSKK